jgi:hypothetical protein
MYLSGGVFWRGLGDSVSGADMSYRYTQQDVKDILARNQPSKSKYGNKKVVVDNIGFDSKREAARYNELKLMAGAGLISDLVCHPAYVIKINGIHICDVILDFRYYDLQKRVTESAIVIEDVKGKDNDLSRLKRKLVEAQYGFKVTLVK